MYKKSMRPIVVNYNKDESKGKFCMSLSIESARLLEQTFEAQRKLMLAKKLMRRKNKVTQKEVSNTCWKIAHERLDARNY